MAFGSWFLKRLAPYPLVRQFIKFAIVGSTSAVINFAFFYSLKRWFGVWYLHASIIGFLVSVIFNFSANKLWTFRNRDLGRSAWRQVWRFSLVMVTGLTINSSIIYGLTDGASLDPNLSWLFATLAVTGWNFSLNRFWTFKKLV